MAAPLSEAPADTRPVFIILLPLMMAVFVAFLVIGVAMPVLPLHVHSGLHLSTFMVGLVAGAQFVAALASRLWSGHVADTRGAKPAVLAGLLAAAVAGLLYWISLPFVDTPFVSVAILLLGRAVLGGAESFIITGATIWGLARVGPAHAGKVIAWMGTAMFAAFAGGAPIGTILYEKEGFGAIAIATLAAPLATMFLMARLQSVAPPPRNGKPHFLTVIGQIWRPGLGAALSSIGFGTVAAFASLLFVERSWSPVWLAFTAYAGALILARLIFGHVKSH
ncbi:MFS transporter [Bosea sp. 47.2.35]|uniref:MFS transporter n=1 Tax=Bosea sp. 47.2.35 TaxID=2969304 RepID=UPI00214FAC56|nr:MFS transporter [Bosea sp. 47.2.35]MCR4524216.1 MFS transporter [Bosea sp. 47.2.35]